MMPPTPVEAPRTLLYSLILALGVGLAGCQAGPTSQPENPDPLADQYRQEAELAEAKRTKRMAELPSAGGTIDSKARPASSKKSEASAKRAAERKLEKAVRDQYQADLELKLAEEKVKHALLKAADDLALAEQELRVAREGQALYRAIQGPELVAKETLKVDRVAFRHEEAAQNLKQMTEEYARYETDGIAKRTGEIVVWRAQTRLDFTLRELEMAKASRDQVRDTTVRRKLEGLGVVVSAKQNGLRRVVEANARLVYENKLTLTKARNQVAYKTSELADMRADAAEAKP